MLMLLYKIVISAHIHFPLFHLNPIPGSQRGESLDLNEHSNLGCQGQQG